MASLFVVFAAGMGLYAVSAFGILPGSPSNFESDDGNMVVDTDNDWESVAFNHLADPAATTTDDSFTPGQKQDTACPAIQGHKNPPKDDFTDVASYSETNSDPNSDQFRHTYLYGATIRYASNGDASENVELKQGDNGFCEGSDLLERTEGDKLIAIDYTQGGTQVDFSVLTWVESGACYVGNHTAPCWGADVQQLSDNAAEGQASQEDILAADNPISDEDLDAGQFAEFGVDLTGAGIIPEGTCEAFPQTVWESRASGSSFVSTTKDVTIEDHTISNCGKITIIKQTDPRGLDQVFDFTSDLNEDANAGGVPCEADGDPGVAEDGSFCLNDSGNSGDVGSTDPDDNSTENTVSEDDLFAGTYHVTEGDNPTGFEFDSVTCDDEDATEVDGKAVTITLAAGDDVTCVYVNNQQQGAIEILKTGKDKSQVTEEDPGPDFPLAGAKFSIKDPDGVALSGSPFTTDDNGRICVDGLGFGAYKVQETEAPPGYDRDDTTEHTVTVDNNATCEVNDPETTDDDPESIEFADTPLTDLLVQVGSQSDGANGTGATESSIECTDGAPDAFPGTDIGHDPDPVTGTTDPAEVDANGLEPGTYTCKVFIDP